LIAIAIPTILFLLSLTGIFPWSRLNCWRGEIDINSGRTRQIRFLFWIPFTGPVNDSPLTKALTAEDLAGRPEDWNSVNTLSPRQHYSPHHNFHGAFFQIHMLESCWESGRLTPAARRETARTVLRLWQEGGNYSDGLGESIRGRETRESDRTERLAEGQERPITMKEKRRGRTSTSG
jgi:hypothetical protein